MFDTVAFAAGVWVVRPDMTTMKVTLDAASEVPPNGSRGTGRGTFDYDASTRLLQWHITYSGLTGPPTAGHVHGPAVAGTNAGVAIAFSFATSPIDGSATLTRAQGADLKAGRFYVNVHTAANPGGEIRGQIVK